MARWLGIDITPTAVRLALLRTSYRKLALEALREERLADHETPSAAIRALCTGLKADVVATAIAGGRCFVRLLQLPRAAQKDLASVLAFEVESTLPVELEDAVMDHRMLKPIRGVDSPEQLPILAGVAYTEEVRESIRTVLLGTGQEPQCVGLGALPLANLALLSPQLSVADPIGILDVGDKHIDFVVLRGGEPRFSRTLSRGIQGLTEEAEKQALSRELKQTLAAWRTQGGAPLSALYVVGSGRDLPSLGHFLQSETGLWPAELPRLVLEVAGPGELAALPRYAKALGLALSLGRRSSDLDLRQGPLQAQQSYQFLREKTPLLAGLAAAMFVSFGFSVFAEMRALSNEREALEQRLESAAEQTFGEKTRDPKHAEQLLDAAIGGKSEELLPRMDAFDVLVELSQRVPKEMVHDIAEFEYNRGQVKVQGIVPTIDDANTVASSVGEHECFKDVNIARTTKLKNEDKQKYTLEFSVRCEAQKPKGKGPKPKAETTAEGDEP
jgi:general secretion pathway protein L